MKKTGKALPAMLLALSLLLTGCASPTDRAERERLLQAHIDKFQNIEENTLLVVSEYSAGARRGGAIHTAVSEALANVVAHYNRTAAGKKVKLQMIPPSGEEREAVLQFLRQEIGEGRGPDVFLLPAGAACSLDRNTMQKQAVESLFPHVETAMRQGVFADLSEYYNADEALRTQELQQDIMNAGVWQGKRCVLPLGWDMPVVCVDEDQMAAAGFDRTLFAGGFSAAVFKLLQSPQKELLCQTFAVPYQQPCLFSQFIDYDNCRLALTEEELTRHFEAVKEMKSSADFESLEQTAASLTTYLLKEDAEFLFDRQGLLQFGDLSTCVDLVGLSRARGARVSVYPLPAENGSTIAEVTYFGAVNAACNDPEEAYRFLREFLLPEAQFQTGYEGLTTSFQAEDCAWPVRITGSVNAKWKAAIAAVSGAGSTPRLQQRLMEVSATEPADDSLPLLQEPIGAVRFATVLTYQLYDNTPWVGTITSPKKGAKSFLKQAERHLKAAF